MTPRLLSAEPPSPGRTASTWLARLSPVLVVGAIWAVAALAYADSSPSRVAIALALTFVPYGFFGLGEVGRPLSLRAVLGLASVAALPLVFAPPTLSDDVFRYLWDGHVALSGVDPYRYAPDDSALASLRDTAWARVNHRDIPTIYPPLAQFLFLLAAALGHGKAVIAAAALAAHLGVTALVAKLAPGDRLRAARLYALNPLALAESALAGHVDVFVGLLLAASVYALGRRRGLWAGLFAGLASGVKLVGVVLLPLFGARHRRGAALAALLSVAALVPLLNAGHGSGVTGGLGQYARRWQGNAGPYALLDAGLTRALEAAGEAQHAPPGHVHLTVLRPALQALRGTFLDPRASLVGEKKETPDVSDFLAGTVAGLVLRPMIVAFVLFLGFALTRRGWPPLHAARAVLLAGLLLAPQVHPWYLLWLLPLEVASGGLAGLVWSATILLAYAPLDAWLASRQWVERPLLLWVEYALVIGALGLEFGLRRARLVDVPSSSAKGDGESSASRTPAHVDPSAARS